LNHLTKKGMFLMKRLGTLVRARAVKPLEGFTVRVEFENGAQREINLEPYLHGPIFEPIRNDPTIFRLVRVERGVISWPNGADIDPDVLYYNLTPAWMEVEQESAL
jgi:hypothetical protein